MPVIDGEKTPTVKSVGGIARLFPGKRPQPRPLSTSDSTLADSSASLSAPQTPITPQDAKGKKRKFGKSSKAGGGEYLFNPENDVLGIVILEIIGAKDLPKLSNSMCTGGCHASQ